jgi:hypothetical protein
MKTTKHIGFSSSLIAGLAFSFLCGCATSQSRQVISDFYGNELSPESNLEMFLSRGLVLHYAFDDDNRTHVVDRSGKENHGQVHDARWISTGKIGGAYNFDGIKSYIDCGNDASLRITGDLTISAWVLPDALAPGQTLVSKHHDAEYDLVFGKNSALTYYHGANWHPNYHTFKLPLLPSGWRHVALTRNAQSKTLRLYVDGQQLKDEFVYKNDPPSTSHNVTIGYRLVRGQHAFKGTIDEVRIYNRLLSSDEVKMLYDPTNEKLRH